MRPQWCVVPRIHSQTLSLILKRFLCDLREALAYLERGAVLL